MLTTNPAMTSREIAVLVEKEHRNVMADIRSMLEQLQIEPAGFSAAYRAGNGQEQPMFVLPKDLTLTLVSGYNVVMRKAIIDRWQELEQAAPPAPRELTRMELLELAMQTERERLVLAEKIAADAPKVAFAEIIRAMDGVCRIGDFCKTMKAGRNKLFARMKADKILMENRMPYQKYIDKGYFSVIEQKPYKDSKGVSHPAFTTMVTGAGQLFLTRKYHDLTGAA